MACIALYYPLILMLVTIIDNTNSMQESDPMQILLFLKV